MIEGIIGPAVFSALIFYVAFKLEAKHGALKVLFLFFGLFFMLIAAKANLDASHNCQMLQDNAAFTYSEVCQDNANAIKTALAGYRIALAAVVSSFIYLIGFIIWIYKSYAEDLLAGFKK